MEPLFRGCTTVRIEPQHATKYIISTVKSLISDHYNKTKHFERVGFWLHRSKKVANTDLARKCDLANYAVPVTECHRQHRPPGVA